MMEPNSRKLAYSAKVKALDVPTTARSWISKLFGVDLIDSDTVTVTLHGQPGVADEERRKVIEDIRRIAAQAEKNIAASGITPEEFEALVDEVCHEVRYGRPA